MSHGIHTLEGPILHDGCTECVQRGLDPSVAIAYMDSQTFAKAWRRAILWQRDGDLPDLQDAETRTLTVLWSVRCAMQPIDEQRVVRMYPDSPITFDEWLDRESALADRETQ